MVSLVSSEISAVDGLHVTDAAFQHLVRLLAQNEETKGVMVAVKDAGCSGLKYVIELVAEPPTAAFQWLIQDTFFLHVPHTSYPFLKGSTIDYVKQGLNAQLRIINPNQTGSCGCGESFSVDQTDT